MERWLSWQSACCTGPKFRWPVPCKKLAIATCVSKHSTGREVRGLGKPLALIGHSSSLLDA